MFNLQIGEDSLEEKFALIYAAAERQELLPPVYIISHRRSDNLRTLRTLPWLEQVATVVVAEPEVATYRAAWPKTDIVSIPPGYGGHDIGVGRAVQFTLEYAHSQGQGHILMLNDDLKAITMLFDVGGGKVSHAYFNLVGDRRQDYFRGVLTLIAECADEAYVAEPSALVASPQANNSNRTTHASSKRWALNQGGNPAQLVSWRVDRFMDLVGGLNLEDFNYHGDDIGVACDIIENGGQLVDLPAFIGHYLDYETESVLRTPETAPLLRQEEHDALLAKPFMGQYIKTREDLLGRPQWHSLDWPRMKADKVARANARLWTDLDARVGGVLDELL